MDIINASEARDNLYRLIDQTAADHVPIMITGPRAKAVLISEEDWNSIQETLYLMAIPGMTESLIAAKNEPLSEASKEPGW